MRWTLIAVTSVALARGGALPAAATGSQVSSSRRWPTKSRAPARRLSTVSSAAGTRVRNAMQELKTFAQTIRNEVTSLKNEGKDESKDDKQ